MTRTNLTLGLLMAALVGLYCYFFTDWFKTKTIQIIPQNRFTLKSGLSIKPISFGLDHPYELTEIKVISASALRTNSKPPLLWHVVTSSNSVPTRGFLYGMNIPGMKPASDAPRPAALEPNEVYRIFVSAGRARGVVDFRPAAPSTDGDN
jgi:hypothetical protein